jgi:hypothetical protein
MMTAQQVVAAICDRSMDANEAIQLVEKYATEKLDKLHGEINAIGGYAGEYDDFGKGTNHAVEQALFKIEDAGGMDPLKRKSA